MNMRKKIPAIFNNVDSASIHFCGRIKEMAILENNLFVANQDKPFIQIIAGLGGIGKTELIKQFIKRNYSRYDIIHWFDFNNIYDSFRSLASSLVSNHFVTIDSLDDLTDAQIIDFVKNTLSQLDTWLLIFDHIDNQEQLAAYLPQFMPERHRQHVMISSRFSSWPEHPQAVTDKMILNTLSEEESLAIFQHWIHHADRRWDKVEDWKKLAQALNYFPLALAQASLYIFESSISVNKYLTFFNTIREELWKSEQPPIYCQHTINTVWDETIQLISQSEAAKHILYCCAVANVISLSQLYQLPFAKEKIDSAIQLLINYFFIHENSNSDLVMLPLLKTVIQDTLSQDEVKVWQRQLNNLHKLSLKATCLERVVGLIAEEDKTVINQLPALPNELMDQLVLRMPRLTSILKKFGHFKDEKNVSDTPIMEALDRQTSLIFSPPRK